MGRPVGSREISVSQIRKIVELSMQGENRPDIAEEAGVSNWTVHKYQKGFDLL